jgi:hypothetical protein
MGCPIFRVLCERWVGLCSPGRPPHFAGPWGFFLAGALSFAFCAKGGSGPFSPTRARAYNCHPEEVGPHVFMRTNNEPGPPAGAAFAPVGVGRGICFCFFGCPTRRSCVWVFVFCLPRVPHPSVLRVRFFSRFYDEHPNSLLLLIYASPEGYPTKYVIGRRKKLRFMHPISQR